MSGIINQDGSSTFCFQPNPSINGGKPVCEIIGGVKYDDTIKFSDGKVKNPNSEVQPSNNATSVINKRNLTLAIPISLLAYSAYKIPKLADYKSNEVLKAGGLAIGGLGIAFVVSAGAAMGGGGTPKSKLISTLGVGAGVAGFSYLALRSVFNQNIVKSNSYALGLGLAALAVIYLNDKGLLGNKNKDTNNVKGGQPTPSGEIQPPVKSNTSNGLEELVSNMPINPIKNETNISNSQANWQNFQGYSYNCDDEYGKMITLKKGSKFEGEITVWGVKFIDSKDNEFDSGRRTLSWGDFEITDIVSREKEDDAPFLQYADYSNNKVKIGTIVSFTINKNVSICIGYKERPLIIYT